MPGKSGSANPLPSKGIRIEAKHLDSDTGPPHPVRHPVMFQDWNSLTFLHWPYAPEVIRACLPSGLELDTFDGLA